MGAPGGCFQFLGIPTKGKRRNPVLPGLDSEGKRFPISRDPHKGGTIFWPWNEIKVEKDKFPISRDPHKGGTPLPQPVEQIHLVVFPISRDPHKGGTRYFLVYLNELRKRCFQFLGIPTKGELQCVKLRFS